MTAEPSILQANEHVVTNYPSSLLEIEGIHHPRHHRRHHDLGVGHLH